MYYQKVTMLNLLPPKAVKKHAELRKRLGFRKTTYLTEKGGKNDYKLNK